MEPLAGLLLGIAGSLHCAGMCGPIALSLPQSNRGSGTWALERILYQIGRIGTYAVLGGIAGWGASVMAIAGAERIVSMLAGSLMILAALTQVLFHYSLIPAPVAARVTAPVRRQLSKLLSTRTTVTFAAIGALNGLLPCGLVVSALFGGIATGNVADGALFMASFGAGTLPVMLAFAFGGSFIAGTARRRLSKAVPFLALAVGTMIFIRGLGLGIPYVSPSAPVSHTVDGCCSKH